MRRYGAVGSQAHRLAEGGVAAARASPSHGIRTVAFGNFFPLAPVPHIDNAEAIDQRALQAFTEKWAPSTG